MQMRQRDVAALDAKYTKELADAKAENDAHVTCRVVMSVALSAKLPGPVRSYYRLRRG